MDFNALAASQGLSLDSKAFAEYLDENVDELRHLDLRSEFEFPTKRSIHNTAKNMTKELDGRLITEAAAFGEAGDQHCVYMIGNSLGLQPKNTRKLLNEELDAWAERGVNAHFDHPHGRPWVSIDDTVTEESAKIVGAKTSEVAIMNSLTANLHFMMVSFYRPTATRFKIIMEAKAFPSDYFAFSSQVQFHGLDPKDAIIEVHPRDGEFTLRTEDILEIIEREGDSTALVLFSGVQFYTGQRFDFKRITDAGHAKGAVVGFDLAHAVGNVELELHEWNVDFACWCTYKYLNAGPGGIGTFSGWWGSDPSSKFAMDNVFRAVPGALGYRLSNPSVVSTVSLLGSLQVFAKTSIKALRQKSLLLTGYLELLLDQLGPNPGFKIITPRKPEERGCQLSLLFDEGTMEGNLYGARRPDVIRISPAPLYCTFQDVRETVAALADTLKCLRLTRSNPTQ
ncbi:pyridoxal phosphate-dependent transferase [Zopfochytrium polystomum]|nr:pyridoxal phosphate-dependent transferase [Zopfochytrium polystomum]